MDEEIKSEEDRGTDEDVNEYDILPESDPEDDIVYEKDYKEKETLSEKLFEQLILLNLSERDIMIAQAIIGTLDSFGYLTGTIEDIKKSLNDKSIEDEDIQKVRELIWNLDPPSIGTRDLRERLIVQSKKRLDYERIMSLLNLTSERLKLIIRFIQKLNPNPAADFSTSSVSISPDFIVTREIENSDDFIIVLNDRHTPPLKLSAPYIEMFQSQTTKSKRFIFFREKINQAKSLLNAIALRKDTLMKTMYSIVKHQKDFFNYGTEWLKPLTLKEIALDTGFDISTISRSTNGKYVQCEFGLFELSHFFSASIPSETGGDVSNQIIKSIIKVLIKNEGEKPLTDEELSKQLANKGYKIARRTVSKYRESLGIPPAKLRRSV
ncbi:hypothetical protein CHS0354_024182 [Potamilus streckersoni]|uniref:RNA polymerase sigma-54 factor n=1 Tax=Potamilus streckersoni TaxID=2493646 RepID=A0AAE0VLF9_9BIVA|nr:hypothetical protein CHS0354_024182 [Potamilus streckersoni]